MRHFSVDPYYWGDDYKIFNKDNVDIKDGVTILTGCNGAGKSTLIHLLKNKLHKENKKVIDKESKNLIYITEYDELSNGRNNAMSMFGFKGDFERLNRNFSSSEGENVTNNFGDYISGLRRKVQKAKSNGFKEFWIFLDGIDSGVSVDMAIEQYGLYELIDKDIRDTGMIPYIIISSNQYETIGEKYKDRCLDVINLEYITIDSYSEFVKFNLHTAKLKKIRYEEGNAAKKNNRKLKLDRTSEEEEE